MNPKSKIQNKRGDQDKMRELREDMRAEVPPGGHQRGGCEGVDAGRDHGGA